ncbi:uncharacterized protein DUF3298 [Ulvibacter sp. MAR_2010_11]|uniref:DUF3298 and DUF4163 domain-containing protein n=1 Tax=Ulvibacter sp. MAR_2010_11 TaxID=1250229 RepID=UPI000C2C4501|nr:DUF3298 and DUF4163 domain-containing protein [Ulvibacter sp. MAR_2010_11]PKA83061.1 uncharacterized protein DUF3298 [Ulvibacter sp. MAR_2010_11]
MIKNLFFAVLFVVISVSCSKEVPLQFASETITESELEICKEVSCPEVTVSYVESVGDPVISEKINSKINDFIISSLYIGDEETPPKAGTISEAIAAFIKMYRTHSAEFPDMATEYFAEVTITENYMSDDLISLEMRNYLFTGGAHGYGSTHFMNIDPKTGEEISTEALFKDLQGFTRFAEEKFREAHELATNETINTSGFWFDNDTFTLPETIGFTKETVILLYNQYDIASYASGPIELEISREEAKPFLKVK